MLKFLAVIPARYASTRFPGKPLADIAGKPMVQHVWERASGVRGLEKIVIATDDARIEAVAQGFGAAVMMTDAAHPSGTDRVWEVAKSLPEYDWILNLQGDEPYINPTHIEAVLAHASTAKAADIITLVTAIDSEAEFLNPNIVKAVLNKATGRALYFSRSPIPYDRDSNNLALSGASNAWRHIGLYLYTRKALETLTQLPPSPLERTERLEQLRALEAGLVIEAVVVDHAPIGIDTPEDLEKLLSKA